MFNGRIIHIDSVQQAEYEMAKLDCDKIGISIMANKAAFKTIKLENIATKEANLLKQTFLAKGGEVAVARGTANLSVPTTDVLICATLKQYRLALAQLRLQPWGLPAVARHLEQVLNYSETFPQRCYRSDRQEIQIAPGRTLIMGILNITPDSFSDGGSFNTLDRALRRVEEMVREGADIIDIGAESTRPYNGGEKISAEEEWQRLEPILAKVIAMAGVPVSIDTYKASIADASLQLGAAMINDVWGLQYDPAMAAVVAKHNVPVVIMHNNEGNPYGPDIMSDICGFLRRSMEIGQAAGIERDRFIVDPGLGFGKTTADNLLIMSRLEELKSLGCPVLLGASRKRFIGETLNLPVEDRMEGNAAVTALGIVKGASIVRVHDVKEMARVAKMTDSIIRSE